MSRTDNTRPWAMQADDPFLLGFITHNHLMHYFAKDGLDEAGEIKYRRWTEVVPCDYNSDNNIIAYKLPNNESPRCHRQIVYCGGWNSEGRNAKPLHQMLERMERRRVKLQLHKFKYFDVSDDMDLHPSALYRWWGN